MATKQELKDLLTADPDVQWALARSIVGFAYGEDLTTKGAPSTTIPRLFVDQDARIGLALAVTAEKIRQAVDGGAVIDPDALAAEIVDEIAKRLAA